MIEISFKDESKMFLEKPDTIFNILHKKLGKKVYEVIVAKVDGQLKDLNFMITENALIEPFYFDDPEGKMVFWHSSAHVLAMAVTSLYPDAKPTIGPPINEGFYYDFDMKPISADDIKKIEDKVNEIIKNAHSFNRINITKPVAYEMFKNNPYKIEILDGIPEDMVSIYQSGNFVDLCHGPHIPNTSYIKAFKITSISSAHFKGDETRPILQRIYGISFPSENMMKDFITQQEEAKKYDHREIGKIMDLYSFHEESPGSVFLHHNGTIIKNELINLYREIHYKAGYQEVITPTILTKDLWVRSGHWDHYKENMYISNVEDRDFAIKPMNCPGAIIIYLTKSHSYKEFPIKLGELGTVYRYERAGTIHGLQRLRQFTQDDAHIFITENMIKEEVSNVLAIVDYVYSLFGLSYHVELSTRPVDRMGSDELWDKAETALKEALKSKNIDYKINEGDGAFYGPKIDVHIKDIYNRTWQCATIQLDFQLPIKFDLRYESEKGTIERPVIIHRVIYGSIERFMGILIEHFKGWLPIWLTPVQIAFLPVSEKHYEYASKLHNYFSINGIRSQLINNDTLAKRIRNCELVKIPLVAVVGDKEIENNSVTLRVHGIKEQKNYPVEMVYNELIKAIKERAIYVTFTE